MFFFKSQSLQKEFVETFINMRFHKYKSDRCVSCLNTRDLIGLDCRHQCVCVECLSKINGICPLCRQCFMESTVSYMNTIYRYFANSTEIPLCFWLSKDIVIDRIKYNQFLDCNHSIWYDKEYCMTVIKLGKKHIWYRIKLWKNILFCVKALNENFYTCNLICPDQWGYIFSFHKQKVKILSKPLEFESIESHTKTNFFSLQLIKKIN